jgi:hypothetical protein
MSPNAEMHFDTILFDVIDWSLLSYTPDFFTTSVCVHVSSYNM